MAEPQIWLIGGTSDSRQLAIALSHHKLPYLVTVTTEAARQLYPPGATVQVGKMTPERIATFAQRHNIVCILDASHPFACEISKQAILYTRSCASALFEPNALSKSLGPKSLGPKSLGPKSLGPKGLGPKQPSVTYLRYERSGVVPEVSHSIDVHSCAPADTSVTMVSSIEALLRSDLLQHQRVLFTLGCRDLLRFSALRTTSQLFARILPSVEAMGQALAAGFTAREIVALRPPVSYALEKALWQQWCITRVVAKASGQPSGEAVKRQIAAELGISLILLKRPEIQYPQQTNDILEAVRFCDCTLRHYSP